MKLRPTSFRSFLWAFAGWLLWLSAAPRCLAVIAGDQFAEAVDLGSAVTAEHVRPADAGLTLEPGEENDITGSHWLTWVCPAAGIYEAKGTYPKPRQGGNGAVMGLDPQVKVFTGTALPSLETAPYVPLGIVKEPKRFRAEPGRRYYFRTGLTPYGGYYVNFSSAADGAGVMIPLIGAGDFTFTLKKLPSPPPNDDFAQAAAVPAGNEVTVTGTNAGASRETGEAAGQYEAGDSVWHRWTVAEAGRYELLLTSPAFLRIAVFSGSQLTDLTRTHHGQPDYNDPALGTVRRRWTAQAGDVRFFRLTGNGYGQQGAYTFRLRRLSPPVNDNLAAALPLEGALPLTASGTTVDASLEEGIDTGNSYSLSSIWWKWRAVKTGWCEMTGDAGVGVMTGSARLGYTLDNKPPFRFHAVAGHVYFLRAATAESLEKTVTFSLTEITGLEHSSPETAVDMGSGPSFSSAVTEVPSGLFTTETGATAYAGVWCRWTAPVSGWVALDTEGSASGAELRMQAADKSEAEYGTATSYNSGAWPGYFVNFPAGGTADSLFWNPSPERRILPETIVQVPGLAPRTGRLLVRVTAGKPYLIQVLPPGMTDGAPAPVKVSLRPAAGPPGVLAVRIRDQPPATVRDAHALEAVISVSSPNGLMRGECGLLGQDVYFADADRISGDGWSGDYRVVVPVPAGFSTAGPVGITVMLFDRRGGFFLNPGTSDSASPPLNIISQPPALTDATADHQPPVVEDGAPDPFGPVQWTGQENPVPEVIRLQGQPVTRRLRFGIRDFGGSGFASGEIHIAADGPSPALWALRTAGRRFAAVPFGSEHRTGGDAFLGVYEVPFTIPADASSGRIMCRLRDAAGNVAGRQAGDQWLYTIADFNGINGVEPRGALEGPDALRGNVNFSDNPGQGARVMSPYAFDDSVVLPFIVEQEKISDLTAPVISQTTAALDLAGNVRLTGRLTDDLSGIAGGEVLMVDKFGLVETRVKFTAGQRTEGTALDGRYEITVPVPRHGFGGAHYLSWSAVDGVGRWTAENLIGPVTLPERTAEDQRRPRLTHFQISPAAVNLTAGPAEISVSLGAGDDRPGLTAVCRILDSAGVLLAERKVGCDKPVLDCVSTLTLPARPLIGLSSAARVELVLTDSAGRTETYGQSGSPAWPDGSAVSLTLGPASDPFTLWAASWPGVPALPPDGARDSDRDGVPDLLEFALGTDPVNGPAADIFRNLMPELTVFPAAAPWDAPGVPVPSLSVNYRFTPAPAFTRQDGRYAFSAWRLELEESTDLLHWITVPAAERTLPSGTVQAGGTVPAHGPGKKFRLRVSR
ncbi:MAG: hypothetical protein V4726_12150 [Verrucomicrobiota bacterium]